MDIVENKQYYLKNWEMRRLDINDNESICLRGMLFDADGKTFIKDNWYSAKISNSDDSTVVTTVDGCQINLDNPSKRSIRIFNKISFCRECCNHENTNNDCDDTHNFFRFHPIALTQISSDIEEKKNESNKKKYWTRIDEVKWLLKNEPYYSHNEEQKKFLFIADEEIDFLTQVRKTGVLGDWTYTDEIWSYKGKPVLENNGKKIKSNNPNKNEVPEQVNEIVKKYLPTQKKSKGWFSGLFGSSFSDY